MFAFLSDQTPRWRKSTGESENSFNYQVRLMHKSADIFIKIKINLNHLNHKSAESEFICIRIELIYAEADIDSSFCYFPVHPWTFNDPILVSIKSSARRADVTSEH